MTSLLNDLKGSVIVSCQARSGEPFDAPCFIAEFAKSAAMAGASGLRIDRQENIEAVKACVDLPIVGIRKRRLDGEQVFITPTLPDVEEVITSGAEIVGMDGTNRVRPGGVTLTSLIDVCHAHHRLVLADVATVEDALYAEGCGADVVATTLSGYTDETRLRSLPDFDLLQTLIKELSIPVLLEGGVVEPNQVSQALSMGAHAVIVGKAITMPHIIARRFTEQALKQHQIGEGIL